MSGELEWPDRRIDDTDVGYRDCEFERALLEEKMLTSSVNLEVSIDNTTELERQLGKRARRVVLGTVLTNEPVVPVVISLDSRAREDLLDHGSTQRSSTTDLASRLETLTEQNLVCTNVR